MRGRVPTTFSVAAWMQMIDLCHRLAVPAKKRIPRAQIEGSLMPVFAHHDRARRPAEDIDLFVSTVQLAGAAVSAAVRPRLSIRLQAGLPVRQTPETAFAHRCAAPTFRVVHPDPFGSARSSAIAASRRSANSIHTGCFPVSSPNSSKSTFRSNTIGSCNLVRSCTRLPRA